PREDLHDACRPLKRADGNGETCGPPTDVGGYGSYAGYAGTRRSSTLGAEPHAAGGKRSRLVTVICSTHPMSSSMPKPDATETGSALAGDLRALVADDDLPVRSLVAKLLQRQGFIVDA